MKKTLKLAAAAAVLTAPAMAANLENPLYMPQSGDVYSKTGAGVMYKVADSSDAHKIKQHDGEVEFPIWRLSEEIGVGVTDNFAIRGAFGYTHDDDIDRKGMHHGRLGVIYRAVDTLDGVKMDIYADAVLGGISNMKGSYHMTPAGDGYFNYDNYSTGRWGADVGIRAGKTWSKLTTSGFIELVRTFGSHNNEIEVAIPSLVAIGFPDEISVNLKNTTEVNFGLNAFYEIDDRWSVGGLFKFTHHSDNGVESLDTDVDLTNPYVAGTVNALMSKIVDMNDGFDEYMIGASVAYQMTDTTQIALYGEYTFDWAHPNSQNGTDAKAEIGVRMNLQF